MKENIIDKSEYKTALRTFIETLEELYKAA